MVMQKVEVFLWFVIVSTLFINCGEPIPTCSLNIKPELKGDKVFVEFEISEHADSILVRDTTYMIPRVGGQGMTYTYKEGMKWSFRRTFLLPKDDRFLIPAVEIYNKGKLVCIADPSWVNLDTIKPEKEAQMKEKEERAYTWALTDSMPTVTALYREQVKLGDTVSLTFKANFPLEDMVAGFVIRGFTIDNARYASTQVKTSNKGEKQQTYIRTMTFRANKRGSFESEAFEVEVAGKTVHAPIVKIKVK